MVLCISEWPDFDWLIDWSWFYPVLAILRWWPTKFYISYLFWNLLRMKRKSMVMEYPGGGLNQSWTISLPYSDVTAVVKYMYTRCFIQSLFTGSSDYVSDSWYDDLFTSSGTSLNYV